MRFQVQALRAQGWWLPLALVAGLALIPLALFVGLALLALSLAVALIRSLLPSSSATPPAFQAPRPRPSVPEKGVLDVEYEIKDDHEKERP